jgi:hypothetical protein
MPAGQLDKVICHLRSVSQLGRGTECADSELLERFIAQRDERAFELLVRRHGPMVLGVCKRILRNEVDAEDAFQATFVVFVRKASSINPRANVGSWLGRARLGRAAAAADERGCAATVYLMRGHGDRSCFVGRHCLNQGSYRSTPNVSVNSAGVDTGASLPWRIGRSQ